MVPVNGPESRKGSGEPKSPLPPEGWRERAGEDGNVPHERAGENGNVWHELAGEDGNVVGEDGNVHVLRSVDEVSC